jgi:cellulose synthase/poly-beta-1,6-N-acetylglucosamine synthase-like glycosyltransferase
MTVSIIIAVKGLNDNLRHCLEQCLKLDYSDFEIIVFPDKPFPWPDSRIRIVATGDLTPPRKRDFALKESKGEVMAFIDDDAYPDRDWLKNALRHFKDEGVGAVCGPAVTAVGEPLRQRASGAVYESPLVSGDQLFRFVPLKPREVDDYPTCNLLVRSSVMRELRGFNTNFWPGEDTMLCSGITDSLKKKIVYDPAVLVYHRRRPLFLGHLRQVANYGLHRGYFAKRGFKSSLQLSYFFPSLLLLGLILGGALALFSPFINLVYFLGISFYLLLVLAFSVSRDIPLSIFKFLGIILTHLAYGYFFIIGLCSRKMKEER